MFGSLTKHIAGDLFAKAVDKLGRYGHAGLPQIGELRYNYSENRLEVKPDPEALEKVKEAWEKYHQND